MSSAYTAPPPFAKGNKKEKEVKSGHAALNHRLGSIP